VRRRIEVHRVGTWHFVDSPLGSSALEELPRFPPPAGRAASGSLRSPLPGIVARVDARPGQQVAEGAVLVVIEAMKLEHRVTAPRAARVAEVLVRPAQEIAAGAVLVVLEGSGEPGTGAPENQAVEEGRDG
jgi:propionyl-CoA carboxylase alpha chain